MKSKKVLIIILSIVLVAIIGIVIYNVRKRKKEENPTGSTATKTSTSTSLGNAFPLQQGSRGDNVTMLQSNLSRVVPPYQLAVDGIFGPKTLAALNEALGISLISKKQAEALSKVTWNGDHQLYYTPLTSAEKMQILQS